MNEIRVYTDVLEFHSSRVLNKELTLSHFLILSVDKKEAPVL